MEAAEQARGRLGMARGPLANTEAPQAAWVRERGALRAGGMELGGG